MGQGELANDLGWSVLIAMITSAIRLSSSLLSKVWVASAYERHTGNDLSQIARLWGHECVYIQAINMIKH